MKKTKILLLLITFSQMCFGQVNQMPKALYIIRNYNGVAISTTNAFIDIAQNDSIYALNDDNQTREACRLLNVDRIVVIKLKQGTTLLTLNRLFKTYNISEKYRDYPIFVDQQLVNFPESILISKSVIAKVKVIKNSRVEIIRIGYYKAKKRFEDNKKKGLIYIR